MSETNKKKGYTSISLGGELLDSVDNLSEKMGDNNRTLTIRKIISKYFELKEKKVDILMVDVDEFIKKVK